MQQVMEWHVLYQLPVIFYKIVNFFFVVHGEKMAHKNKWSSWTERITFSKKVEQRIEQVINFNNDGTIVALDINDRRRRKIIVPHRFLSQLFHLFNLTPRGCIYIFTDLTVCIVTWLWPLRPCWINGHAILCPFHRTSLPSHV